MRERVLVIRGGKDGVDGVRALEGRYPDLEFVYCESFLSGIVEASRGSVRAMLARVDGGPRRLTEAVGALREAGGREAKIVLCCSPEHEPQAQEAMAGGADDYVIEPLRAADVDRAIGYGRVAAEAMGGSGLPPAVSMEELARLAELFGMIEGPPREMLQKAVDLVREALSACGATIVVEGAVVQSGKEGGAPVLRAELRRGENVIGQVSVGEREGIKGSRDRGIEKDGEPSPLPLSQGERGTVGTGGQAARGTLAYTLGDAQKLEHYAAMLSQVIAAASRQRQLRRLAVTDEASGLPNRRYLREQLAAILQRAAAERFPVTVLLFDVDDFKAYNDRFGHGAGDEILRVTGELFRKNCREQDVVARYGGDEFAVVFYDPQGPREPGSKPPAEALFVLDRFKDELRTLRVRDRGVEGGGDEGTRHGGQASRRSDEGDDSRITISGGLATYPWDGGTVDALLTAADEALLAAKRAGKNRIFVVGEGR